MLATGETSSRQGQSTHHGLGHSSAGTVHSSAGTGDAGFWAFNRARLDLSHPERILWKEAGITKQGLAEFYADIANWILPHIAGRPLSLLRCPSGTAAKCFFAKHPWQGLKSVRRVDTGDKEPMLAIDDITGLISLVQAGVVEIHPWGRGIVRCPHRLADRRRRKAVR